MVLLSIKNKICKAYSVAFIACFLFSGVLELSITNKLEPMTSDINIMLYFSSNKNELFLHIQNHC